MTVILSKDACQNPCQGDARIRHTLQTFEDPANLIGQGDPGKVLFLIVGVYATKEELGARGSMLETEHRRRQYTFRDKILDWRICAIDRYQLETHAHQTVRREIDDSKPCIIVGCGAKRLGLRL